MVFKLIRTDTEGPKKITLPIGTHIIGRGKYLDCDDKKVSRNHGEIQTTDKTVTLKALNQNPCFYMKKGTTGKQILKQCDQVELSNGDKLGLLPDSYWYELLCMSDNQQSPENERSDKENIIDSNREETNEHQSKEPETTECSDTIRMNDSEDRLGNAQGNEEESGNESQLLIQNVSEALRQPLSPGAEESTQKLDSPSLTAPGVQASSENREAGNSTDDEISTTSPEKRRLTSEDSDNEVKKIKTEPVEVKQEPVDAQPGHSNDQLNADAPVKDDQKDGQPQPLRERCMYGANCYRRNPLHKAQFSHPADADWGAGDTAPCPWGRACRRSEPRHWRDHAHPPGVRPPGPPGPPASIKRKRSNRESDREDSFSPDSGLIITGKRNRKTVRRTSWSGTESESEPDPFGSDEADEWVPGSEDYTQTQDY